MKTRKVATPKKTSLRFASILKMLLIVEIIITSIVIINTHIVIEKNDAEIRELEKGLERSMTIIIPVHDAMEKVDVDDIKVTVEKEIPEVEEITFETEEDEDYSADKELLAQVMYAEEGVFLRKYEENPERVERVFKLAGSVVLNRVKTNYMGAESISDVIYEKGQYAEQTQARVREGQDVPDIVYVWADDLLTNGTIGPEGLVFQAEFEQGEFYERIGNQVFGSM